MSESEREASENTESAIGISAQLFILTYKAFQYVTHNINSYFPFCILVLKLIYLYVPINGCISQHRQPTFI